MKLFKKTRILQSCRHSALDVESNVYNNLGIPACARMTGLRRNDLFNDFFKGFYSTIQPLKQSASAPVNALQSSTALTLNPYTLQPLTFYLHSTILKAWFR